MENSSSTHAAWLSLGVAAMVGATVAAASSYMVHCRVVKCLQSQRVLDVGDPRKRRVGPGRGRTNKDPLPGSSSTISELVAQNNGKSFLSSLPPRLPKGPSSDSIGSVPTGLPRIHTRKEDGVQSAGRARRQPGSLKPVLGVSSIRPSSPNSLVAGGSYESVEGSVEEDHLLPSNEEDNYNEDFEDDDSKSDMEADGQRNGGSELVDGLERPQSPSAENAVLKAAAEKSGSSLIRSHSIAGDLHDLHAPDPVAADILRKEPEQETYVKLNVSPIELEVDQHSNI